MNGATEVVYYPVWLLAIEVVRRLPLLGSIRSYFRGVADGVSGKIGLLNVEAAECEVEADQHRVIETRIHVDPETRRLLEEKFVPFVLTRLRNPAVAPSIQIVGVKRLYKKVYRMGVTRNGGEWVVYVDTATREYACLPAETVSKGAAADGSVVMGTSNLARDSQPS